MSADDDDAIIAYLEGRNSQHPKGAPKEVEEGSTLRLLYNDFSTAFLCY